MITELSTTILFNFMFSY